MSDDRTREEAILEAVGEVNKKLRNELNAQVREIRERTASKQEAEKLEETLTASIERLDQLEKSLSGLEDLREIRGADMQDAVTRAVSEVEAHLQRELELMKGARAQNNETLLGFGERLVETFDSLENFKTTVVEAQEKAQSAEARIIEVASDLGETDGKVDALKAQFAEDLKAFREKFERTVQETVEGIPIPEDLTEELQGALTRVEEAEGRLETVESRTSETGKALEDMDARLDSAKSSLEEMMKSLRTAATEEDTSLREEVGSIEKGFENRIADIRAELKSLSDDRDELMERWKGLRSAVDEEMNDLARRVINTHQDVKQWLRGDPGYQATALVVYRGGVWKALVETVDEPGLSEDWVLVIDGAHDAEITPSKNNNGDYTITHHMASGAKRSFDVPFPPIKDTGTWEKGKTYGFFEGSRKDGHFWLNLKAENDGEPGSSDGWLLLGQRGNRGPRGKRWTEDETRDLIIPIAEALTGEEIEKQLFPAIADMMDTGVGIPLLRYRQMYENDRAYARGEVVTAGNALFIAREDIPANGPPPLALSTTPSPWITMLVSEGGGGGGGGGYTIGQANGVEIATSDGTINLVGTGDTTVSAASVGGVTTWTINSIPGGAGGGIVKGTPFDVGELLEASSDVGGGEAVSSGLTVADINGHIGDGTIHFTEGSIDHGSIQGLGDDDHPQYLNNARGDVRYDAAGTGQAAADVVQSNLDTHISDPGDPHPQYLQDAPSDNEYYGRRNGQWDPIEPIDGWPYRFNSTTNTSNSPGIGFVSMNSSTFPGVTQLAISDSARDGYNLRTWLLGMVDGSEIRLRDDLNAAQSGVFEVSGAPVGQSGFVQVNVTFVEEQGGGPPSNNDPVSIPLALGGAANINLGGGALNPGTPFTLGEVAVVSAADEINTTGLDAARVTQGPASGSTVLNSFVQWADTGGTILQATGTQIVGPQIADEAISNARMENMPGATFKGRAPNSTGVPSDIDINALSDGGSPGATDNVLGKNAAGEFVRFAGDSLGGGTGTYNETTKDGASISVGRSILEFRDTGDATVTVTDDAPGDRTIIEVNATAGVGGGGVGAGTPFVVGEITEISSDAGDGEIISTGLTVGTITAHIGDATIHFTEASIDHTAIQNVGANTHAQIDAHIADTDIHFSDAPVDTNEYQRSNQGWKLYELPGAAPRSGFWGNATTGESFGLLDVVQVRRATPAVPGDRYALWPRSEYDVVDPAAIYDLPDTDIVGPNSGQYSHQTLAGASSTAFAWRFQVFDATIPIGTPVTWSITNITRYGNMNTAERANCRYEIHEDNAGEPGAVLYNKSNFDYSAYSDTAGSVVEAPANDEDALTIANGQFYWIVIDQQQADNPITASGVSFLDNYTTDPDRGTRGNNEYVIFDQDDANSIKFFNGAAWVNEPSVLRVSIDVKRQTALTAPSSIYAVMLDPVSDSGSPARALSYGLYKGDTTGSIVGETWQNNQPLFVRADSKLTNVIPADPRDTILMGYVLEADANGSLMITASATGTRGVYMNSDVYDPRERYRDVFNLNNIDRGELESYRVLVDNGDWQNIVGDDLQDALDSIDSQLGGAGGIPDVLTTQAELLTYDGANYVPITPGSPDTFLKMNSAGDGHEYGVPPGGGDFVGPGSSVANNFVSFADTSGKLGEDSGFSGASFDAAGSSAGVQSNLDTHIGLQNPHGTTASDVGALPIGATAVFRNTHTWTISGSFDDTINVLRFYVGESGSQTLNTIKIIAYLDSGNAITGAQLLRNGTPIVGLDNISITPGGPATIVSATEALVDEDYLRLNFSNAFTGAVDLSFTVVVESTVTVS